MRGLHIAVFSSFVLPLNSMCFLSFGNPANQAIALDELIDLAINLNAFQLLNTLSASDRLAQLRTCVFHAASGPDPLLDLIHLAGQMISASDVHRSAQIVHLFFGQDVPFHAQYDVFKSSLESLYVSIW